MELKQMLTSSITGSLEIYCSLKHNTFFPGRSHLRSYCYNARETYLIVFDSGLSTYPRMNLPQVEDVTNLNFASCSIVYICRHIKNFFNLQIG